MTRHALFIDHVPEDTRTAFKAACVRKGKSMKSVLLKFMAEYAVANPDTKSLPHKFLAKPDHPFLCDICGQHQALHEPKT